MSNNVKSVIQYAENNIGYLEKASPSQLDSKLANAGNNNFTKFARDLDAIKFNNGNKQGYAWCTIFVQAMFYYCFGKDNALKILYEPSSNNLGASVEYMARYFANNHETYSKAKIGDIVVFSNSHYHYAHVGIVVNIDSNKITTIEGNTSVSNGVVANGGAVAKKTYDINNKNIVTYCRPNWSIVGGYDYNVEPISTKFTLTIPSISLGSKGEQVRSLQKILIAYGYSVGKAGADGDFGKNTHDAVIEFQRRNKLSQDGIVGKDTYSKILSI